MRKLPQILVEVLVDDLQVPTLARLRWNALLMGEGKGKCLAQHTDGLLQWGKALQEAPSPPWFSPASLLHSRREFGCIS